MSAKGRGPSSGGPEDYFTTPTWLTRRLLEAWVPERDGLWVEPGAGNGAIIRAVNAVPGWRQRWHAFEVREEERATLEALCPTTIGSFLTAVPGSWAKDVTVVLGNPPYTYAYEFLVRAHWLFPNAEVVFLLRTAFTMSQERYAFMSTHYPDKMDSPDRPSFTGGGGDSADYSWMRWPKNWKRTSGRSCLLRQTLLEERKLDRGHDVTPVSPQTTLFG